MKNSSFIKIAFFIVIFGIGNVCFAQTLWQNTTYGMTLNEVKGLYPKATTVTKDNSASDGSKELLNLANVKLFNNSFSVGFFFKEDKLTRIYLTPIAKLNKSNGEKLFNTLRNSLTKEYGQSIKNENENGAFFSTNSNTWLINGVSVFLSSILIGDNTTLYILYHIEDLETKD